VDLQTEKGQDGNHQLMFSVRAATLPFICSACKSNGSSRRLQPCEWCFSELHQLRTALHDAEQHATNDDGTREPKQEEGVGGQQEQPSTSGPAQRAALPDYQRLALAEGIVDGKGYDRLSEAARQQVLGVMLKPGTADDVQLGR
jgi:hypothetical protein